VIEPEHDRAALFGDHRTVERRTHGERDVQVLRRDLPRVVARPLGDRQRVFARERPHGEAVDRSREAHAERGRVSRVEKPQRRLQRVARDCCVALDHGRDDPLRRLRRVPTLQEPRLASMWTCAATDADHSGSEQSRPAFCSCRYASSGR
jgi:hypothetical protein